MQWENITLSKKMVMEKLETHMLKNETGPLF